jgi:hypothetical protein
VLELVYLLFIYFLSVLHNFIFLLNLLKLAVFKNHIEHFLNFVLNVFLLSVYFIDKLIILADSYFLMVEQNLDRFGPKVALDADWEVITILRIEG